MVQTNQPVRYAKLLEEQRADAEWQKSMREIDKERRVAERKGQKRAARWSLLWHVPLGLTAAGFLLVASAGSLGGWAAAVSLMGLVVNAAFAGNDIGTLLKADDDV